MFKVFLFIGPIVLFVLGVVVVTISGFTEAAPAPWEFIGTIFLLVGALLITLRFGMFIVGVSKKIEASQSEQESLSAESDTSSSQS